MNHPGGQLMFSSEVEDFPGFPKGLNGEILMRTCQTQAVRFGTEILLRDVTRVDFTHRPLRLWSEAMEYTADAVIVATGASARRLGLENEAGLMGFGVSMCAGHDADFFKNLEVAVIGGGDRAVEDALFLSKCCSKVTLVHRRSTLRASKILQERALANPSIEYLWNSLVTEVTGDRKTGVTGIRVKHLPTGEGFHLPCNGLFPAIGNTPNTSLFSQQLDMNEAGYLITRPGTTRTNIDGVFAAGEVQDFTYRKAIIAAGSGCMAALEAERWLNSGLTGEIQTN